MRDVLKLRAAEGPPRWMQNRLMQNRLMKDRRGLAALEFAMIAPVLITCVLGIFEITEAFRAQTHVDAATDMLAKMVTHQSTTTKAQMQDFCYGVKMGMAPFTSTSFTVSIASVTNTSGKIAVDWEYDVACGSPAAPALGNNAVTMATPRLQTSGSSVVVAVGQYNYASALTYFVPSLTTMTFSALPTPQYPGSVLCPDC